MYHANDLQVALLREKLAKEQQRARAAEATLAAQHQMQELLQCAVQAVLLARNSTQVHLLHGLSLTQLSFTYMSTPIARAGPVE